MPVYKRAARPTAASASADPRDPHSSENDFTVLFQRVRADAPGRRPPPARSAPSAPLPSARARHVEPPGPAPKPPVPAERSKRSAARSAYEQAGSADSTAPPVTTAPASAPIETVAVPPRLRQRALRVAVFLALGSTLGVGVEGVVHRRLPGVSGDPSAFATSDARSTPSAPDDGRGRAANAASIAVASDKVVIIHPPHHHHHHAAAGASAAPVSIAPATSGDAGGEPDDVSAAIQTLTQAKEEVTLP